VRAPRPCGHYERVAVIETTSSGVWRGRLRSLACPYASVSVHPACGHPAWPASEAASGACVCYLSYLLLMSTPWAACASVERREPLIVVCIVFLFLYVFIKKKKKKKNTTHTRIIYV